MEDIIGKTIYAPTKTGNIKTWECHVSHNVNGAAALTIITRTKLDGKPVVRDDIITQGKNLGKSNETTPFEQATNEAKSKYNKKQDQGYSLEIPTDISKASCNALGLPRPMLAYSIDKVKVIGFPAYWQRKYDGHRCLATRKDGNIIFYSRQGKAITTMGHLTEHLDALQEGEFLDGELYCKGKTLQAIGSLVKKWCEESLLIVFNVYDIIMNVPYSQRYQKLCDMNFDPSLSVVLVDTRLVNTENEAYTLTTQAIADGYEGGILRIPDKGYQAGFRSRQLLKIKTFEDAEFEVIDIVAGKDRRVNNTHLKVAVFVCETQEGKKFEVTAHGNQYEKDRIWHEKERHIGRLVTVKFYSITEKGIPFHPVALQWREDL